MEQDMDDQNHDIQRIIRDVRTELKGDLASLQQAVAALQGISGPKIPKQPLVAVKNAIPDKFAGKSDESFKAWAPDLKAYANANYIGFRVALTWTEGQLDEIDVTTVAGISWKGVNVANVNAELYDLMITITAGEAKEKVLSVPKENGFEAFRKLSHWHDSCCNMNALERFNKL